MASFSIDIASITINKVRRDSYFRNSVMQASRFPTATLEVTEPVVAAAEMHLVAIHAAGSIPIKFAHYGEEFWRYRVGDYRILTNIDDDQILILIVEIAHRREVYNKL